MGANGPGRRVVGRHRVKAEISFEFFPPRTERGRHNLARTVARLARFSPTFHSVTYGAGGSTRDRTLATVASLRAAGFETAPHLSWVGTGEDVLKLVTAYREIGVDRIVALRGDAASGAGPAPAQRHAEALVRLLRGRVDGPLALYVAAYPEVHPEAPSASVDIDYLKSKVDAGADACITQYFYNAEAYFHFRDRCEAAGIAVPIVPGVMPIANRGNLLRFSAKAGADVPRWIRQRLDELDGDDKALGAFGTEVVTALCQRLLAHGAPGLHFYTLNKAAPTVAVANNLALAAPD